MGCSTADPVARFLKGRAPVPKTVLLVEDDLSIREIVQDLLEEQGYDVVPARTGRQALEFLTGDPVPPALVLLDLMMPFVTGWQVLEEMRRDPRLARIPVVVLTAMSQDRPPGATALMRKPFRLDTLLATVRHHLDRPPTASSV